MKKARFGTRNPNDSVKNIMHTFTRKRTGVSPMKRNGLHRECRPSISVARVMAIARHMVNISGRFLNTPAILSQNLRDPAETFFIIFQKTLLATSHILAGAA